jgi:hypothetical protein
MYVPALNLTLHPWAVQVVALKAQYPGVLLVVEVGYKMRFFGEDAQVAASVLRCYCYPDHNFLTASIPVPRLPVHVRRLVQAGYKVRQGPGQWNMPAMWHLYTVVYRLLLSLLVVAVRLCVLIVQCKVGCCSGGRHYCTAWRSVTPPWWWQNPG